MIQKIKNYWDRFSWKLFWKGFFLCFGAYMLLFTIAFSFFQWKNSDRIIPIPPYGVYVKEDSCTINAVNENGATRTAKEMRTDFEVCMTHHENQTQK